MPESVDILKKLGLSQSEIDVYHALLIDGSLTAVELLARTHLKRPTLYYSIRQLQDKGLVHIVNDSPTNRYQAEEPEKLLTMVQFRQEELRELAKEVSRTIPSLKEGIHADRGIPVVSYYHGDENMKQAIMDTLYCRSRHIDALAPKQNFFWEAGQAFSQRYVDQRAERHITTRHLWEEPLPNAIMKRTYAGADIRILPLSMRGSFRTAMFLYDDTVMYISSRTSGYVLVVKSAEHYALMKSMYDAIWSAAKPLLLPRFKK